MGAKGGKNNPNKGLFKHPRKKGLWNVRLWTNGKPKEYWLGVSRTEAKEFYDARKKEMREDRFELNQFKKTSCPPLKDIIDDAVGSCVGSDLKNKKGYAKYFKDKWGDRPADKITSDEVKAIRTELVKDGALSHGTINHRFVFLQWVFNQAIEAGRIKRNPVTIKRLNVPTGRLRYLTEEEELRLIEYLTPHQFNLVRFAINTGLRQSEQFDLKWSCVDIDNRVLTIPKSKSGKTRHVPMNDDVVAILKGLNSFLFSRYVFPSEDPKSPLDGQNFYKRVFIDALTLANIEGANWHTLRHTFASRLAMKGVDIYTISKLLGHSSVKMTQVYSHLSPSHLKDAVNKLSEVIKPASQDAKPRESVNGDAAMIEVSVTNSGAEIR